MFIEIATCLWAFSFANVEGQTLDAGAFRDEGILVYVSLEPLTNVCISETAPQASYALPGRYQAPLSRGARSGVARMRATRSLTHS